MAVKAIVLTLCAFASNEATAAPVPRGSFAAIALTGNQSLTADLHKLRHHFDRSESDHVRSMNAIMETMTPHAALDILKRNRKASPELVALAQTAVSHTHLRASVTPPKGLNAVDGAKWMVNSLLEETMKKYDVEILKCRDFYTKQCGMLDESRGTIAASNFQVAACRTHILAAESQISVGEANIPPAKQNLKDHRDKCKEDVAALHKKLSTIQGDIETMTKILGYTDCSGTFLQISRHSGRHVEVLNCKRDCDKASLLSFGHAPLRKHIDSLKSNVAHELLRKSFSDLSMIQESRNTSSAEKLRRTVVPPSPCTDPNMGAPTPEDKRAAKCTVSSLATCDVLQERFILIQSGLKDTEDDMKDDVVDLENTCQKTEEALSRAVEKAEQTLKEYQTKLAEGTSCENEAAEEGRLANTQFQQMSNELHKMKVACSENYQAFENEMCGMKKIRSELYIKMKGISGKPFIQDCKLSEWSPGECSAECGGGVQTMTRTVDTQPQGGAQCLPLTEVRRCNEQPCPVDCKLSSWSGWSSCSAECGGGVQERLRDVERNMKHNGNPCGEVSETKPCNVQACEADCELHDWAKWGKCSKACAGGTRKRMRHIKTAATGGGECPSPTSSARTQFVKCNKQKCPKANDKPTITCESTLDFILVLDGSSSVGREGWAATKKAALMIIDSLDPEKAQVAVLVFSGPSRWDLIDKCYKDPSVDQEAYCKMKWVTHMTNDFGKTKSKVEYLQWPKGGTMTSLALQNALAETQLGRQDAKTVVAVITDGKPQSARMTRKSAKAVRKVARLMWIPVTKYAPLRFIRRMASRRWQENVILANSFQTLEKPEFVDNIISDMCPQIKGLPVP